MATDYNALAQQAGAIDSQPPAQPPSQDSSTQSTPVDYGALAKQAGAISSQPAPAPVAAAPATQSTASKIYNTVGQFSQDIGEAANKTVNDLYGHLAEIPPELYHLAVDPPKNGVEALAHVTGGTPALASIRAATGLVQAAKQMYESTADNYQESKAKFNQALAFFHAGDYKNAAASAGAATGASIGMVPGGSMVGQPITNVSESLAPGAPAGSTSKALAGTAVDAATALTMGKAPEIMDTIAGLPKAAGEAVGSIRDALAKKAANKVALVSSDELIGAHQDFKEAIPSTKAAPYEEHDLLTAENYLEHHHENIQPIRTVQDTVDALDHSVAGIEDEIAKHVGLIPREPIATDVLADVKSALQQNERGAEFVNAGMKELESLNLDNIDMQRADSVRRQLNLENKAVLKENDYDLAAARASSPAFAAREAAAESLRNGIYNQMEAHGIEGAKELRQEEGSLLKIRNASYNQLQSGDKVVRGSSGASRIQKIAAKTAQVAAAIGGAGMGATVLGVPGAMAGGAAGTVLGGEAAEAIAPQDLTRDQLVERRFNKYKVRTGDPGHITVPKGIQAPPPATPPVGTQGVIPPPIPPATPGTPAQPNLFGTTAPYPANAVLQSPQAQLASLQTQIRPLKAILDDPTATQAAKVEAARQLSALPLASLQNPTIETGASAAEKAAAAKTPLPTPVTTPQSIVEAAGGTFRGAYPNGMVEVTLPRSMTESLPIDNKLKDFVSVTIPKEKMTPEFIKSEMARKVGEITKGAEKKAAAIAEAKPVAKNASGESAASKEAISRIAAEKEAGITYSRVDTRSNVAKPLAPGVDIVDMKAGPYDRIVKHIPGKPDQVMDEGAKARPARGSFKDKLRSALTASGALGGENA